LKTLIAGIVLTVAAWIWLLVASCMGESPTHFVETAPIFDPGSNLNFLLYNAFVPIAHATLGAGIALCVLRQRERHVTSLEGMGSANRA
jgi:hypothetical protein